MQPKWIDLVLKDIAGPSNDRYKHVEFSGLFVVPSRQRRSMNTTFCQSVKPHSRCIQR
jgi:hypothetical protein